MMRPARATRFGGLTACAFLGSLASASAQGTPEQQAACAPDAVKLCSDTIPDVERTKACMQRHEAQLSPRCHRAFVAATEPGDRNAGKPVQRRARPAPADEPAADAGDDDMRRRLPRRDETARDEDDHDDYGPPRYEYLAPDGSRARTGPADRDARAYDHGGYDERGPDARDDDEAPSTRDARERARAEIGRLCQDGELDPRTCDTTERALDMGR